jgi:hypothetical protein
MDGRESRVKDCLQQSKSSGVVGNVWMDGLGLDVKSVFMGCCIETEGGETNQGNFTLHFPV